jgi:hypothetical protein
LIVAGLLPVIEIGVFCVAVMPSEATTIAAPAPIANTIATAVMNVRE